MRRVLLGTLALVTLHGATAPAQETASRQPLVVGSKPFGESYLLAEMFAQVLESSGIPVIRRPGLGATEVAFNAMRQGALDVFPEYTGTGLVAVLHDSLPEDVARNPLKVFSHVSARFENLYGIRWLPPLGFENTYAIAVRKETAAKYHLATLTDLAREGRALTAGLTSDFIGRPDGLEGLSRSYGLKFKEVRALSPALKYQALAQGAVDVVDGYSTDGLLARYDLVVLEDDRRFFPPYQAAAIVSRRVASEFPDAVAALTRLSGKLDEATMRKLNQRVEVDREEIGAVAQSELQDLGILHDERHSIGTITGRSTSFIAYVASRRNDILDETLRHLLLSAVALIAATIVAVPLGLFLERQSRVAESVLGLLGVLETIPSIALLAFMLPLLGVGVVPALVALWLYALYPIARATYTGVKEAEPDAVEAAEALGVTPVQQLLWIRLPLATPVIMSGVRTAAVIIVGAATLAAFIGAGGLGEPIVQGLALADTRLVLTGAIPAALLAIVVDRILAAGERALRPAHLRGRRTLE